LTPFHLGNKQKALESRTFQLNNTGLFYLFKKHRSTVKIPTEFQVVEDQLISTFRPGTILKMNDPIRMLSVEIAIGIDHFGFNPQPESHSQAIDIINQGP
jgi:hypothetical protein